MICDWLDIEFLNVLEGPHGGSEVCGSVGSAAYGDKLFGWPAWPQFANYPVCDHCECPMRHLLQIDSDCTLPIPFGDAGTAHLFYCEEHRSNLALIYQS
ncbi:MAG: hypothetical protein AAFP69_03780 [Planctomycetota bacterium]